jgi:hypothetical protein
MRVISYEELQDNVGKFLTIAKKNPVIVQRGKKICSR